MASWKVENAGGWFHGYNGYCHCVRVPRASPTPSMLAVKRTFEFQGVQWSVYSLQWCEGPLPGRFPANPNPESIILSYVPLRERERKETIRSRGHQTPAPSEASTSGWWFASMWQWLLSFTVTWGSGPLLVCWIPPHGVTKKWGQL